VIIVKEDKMKRKRIIWIDLVRGLGMLLIIWGHSLNNPRSFLGTLLFEVNVPIFFLLSGYLYHEQKFNKQLYKLFYNLIIPYIVTCALMGINTVIANKTGGLGIFKSMGSIKDVIKASFFAMGTPTVFIGTHVYMPAIGAIWFLIALLWDELLFNFIIKKTKHKKCFLTIMNTVSLLLLVLGFYLIKFGILPWSLNASMIGFVFMWVGFLLKKINFDNFTKLKILKFEVFMLAGWCLAGVFKVYFWMNIASTNNIFLGILSAFCGSIFLITVIEKITNKEGSNGVLKFVSLYGKYSLIVLCTHIIDGNTLCLNKYFGLIINQPQWLITLLNFSYHVIITIFGIYIVIKIPLLRSIYDNREEKFKWQI